MTLCSADVLYFFVITSLIFEARQRWSAKLFTIFVAWVPVYQAGLIFGTLPNFYTGVGHVRSSLFSSAGLAALLFYRIRQVAPTAQEQVSSRPNSSIVFSADRKLGTKRFSLSVTSF